MKKIEYKIIVSDKGFNDFEEKVSEKLNDGWKPIGGIAFNHSYPHQAMAKVVEVKESKEIKSKEIEQDKDLKALTANEAMKRLDDLT